MENALRDPIFMLMPSEAIAQVAEYLSYTPVIALPEQFGQIVPLDKKLQWFDTNRLKIEDEMRRVGSRTFGKQRNYVEILSNLAKKMKVKFNANDTVYEIEKAILIKYWNAVLTKLTPEQKQELIKQAEELAKKYGKNISNEVVGLSAISIAQLSGFGVYMLASTALGAVNSALSLGLSFGVFMGLSSILSIVIGPTAVAGLGLSIFFKLTAPNYEKILKVVILLVLQRQALISELETGSFHPMCP